MASPIKCKPRERDLKKFRTLFPEPKSLRVISVNEYGFDEDDSGTRVDSTIAVLQCAGNAVRFVVRFPREKHYVEISFLDDSNVEHKLCSMKRFFEVETYHGLKGATIMLIDSIRRNLLLENTRD